MVLCVVVGCSKRSGRDKDVSFYKLSEITASKGSRVLELSKKRRAGYIDAISRGDLTEKILANDGICSRHFINGKPASLENNPDWLPTLNLGHSKVCIRFKLERGGAGGRPGRMQVMWHYPQLQQLQVKMMLEKNCMIMPVLVFLPLKRTKAVMKLMVVLMSHVMPELKQATHHLAMSVFRLTCPLLW